MVDCCGIFVFAGSFCPFWCHSNHATISHFPLALGGTFACSSAFSSYLMATATLKTSVVGFVWVFTTMLLPFLATTTNVATSDDFMSCWEDWYGLGCYFVCALAICGSLYLSLTLLS